MVVDENYFKELQKYSIFFNYKNKTLEKEKYTL